MSRESSGDAVARAEFPVVLDALPDLSRRPRELRKPDRVQIGHSESGPYVEWWYDLDSPHRWTTEEERKGILRKFLHLAEAPNAATAVETLVRTYGPLAHRCEHEQQLSSCTHCEAVWGGPYTPQLLGYIFYWRTGGEVRGPDRWNAPPMRELISVYLDPARELSGLLRELASLRKAGSRRETHDDDGRRLARRAEVWLYEWQRAAVDWNWRLAWVPGEDRMDPWIGSGARGELLHRVVAAFEHPGRWHMCTGCKRAYERELGVPLPKEGGGNFCEECRGANYKAEQAPARAADRARKARELYHDKHPGARYYRRRS